MTSAASCPATLNEEVALGLGRAFGTAARAKATTVVAPWGATAGCPAPLCRSALMQGLVEAGIEVIDVGLVTTPMLYFAASTLCTSGIQVTGSHNPKDYNGFKMVLNGRAIYGDEIQALRRTMEAEKAGNCCPAAACARPTCCLPTASASWAT
jgi:phosphomannomutase